MDGLAIGITLLLRRDVNVTYRPSKGRILRCKTEQTLLAKCLQIIHLE